MVYVYERERDRVAKSTHPDPAYLRLRLHKKEGKLANLEIWKLAMEVRRLRFVKGEKRKKEERAGRGEDVLELCVLDRFSLLRLLSVYLFVRLEVFLFFSFD